MRPVPGRIVHHPASEPALARIPHQAAPYQLEFDGGSDELMIVGTPGDKAPGVLWNYSHHADGGWNDRGFARMHWWDYDTSGVDGEMMAGFTEVGSLFRPESGWSDAPYYLRFRIRVNSPLVPHPSTTETQMKFFIWASYGSEGTMRPIVMFWDGAAGGGTIQDHTTIDVRAGVSGSRARTTFGNHAWHHIQIAWRWGEEGVAYQRIYVDQNDPNRPTAENTAFTDLGGVWQWPGDALDNQFFWCDISNTGSRVAEDAEIDVMDMEIGETFDPNWAR